MNDVEERVILVDESDAEIGIGAKLRTHEEGLLHRAFSIYAYNERGELLMQKRSRTKYHSGGLWTNTCCGHPRPGEDVLGAAHRRLREEMGFDCALQEIPSITYRVKLDTRMIEHEFLHLFVGLYNTSEAVVPDPNEAESYAWTPLSKIEADMALYPDRYTVWLKICWPHVRRYLREHISSLTARDTQTRKAA